MSHFNRLESPARPDWRRAWRAIQVMRADPNRTDQVFELNVALDGGDSERHFQGLLVEADGADLLRESPELLDHLTDVARLKTLPADSLGAAYLNLMGDAGYAADGLQREAQKVQQFAELHRGGARTWWSERGNCVHDLLHVITGYGQDPAGETALLAFTDGLFGRRFRMRVIRFGLFGSIVSSPRGSRLRTIAFAWQARRRGSRARIPFSFRWEQALERPLQEVRRQLCVAPNQQAHPRGMLRGSMEAPWSLQRPATP